MQVLSQFVFATVVLCGIHQPSNNPSAIEITETMIERTKDISTLTYTMTRQERLKGKHEIQVASVKLRRKPYMVYTKQIKPKEGLEVLYVEGMNSGKALVNPNKFPWINLKLDPLGKVMCKNQHHTILDSGYDRLVSILEHLITKYGDQANSMMQLQPDTLHGGHPCWVIQFNNPNFQLEDYTVEADESLLDIAMKHQLNAHMLLENNPSVNSYDDIKTGQIIKVPRDYCERMIIYIDQMRKIPLQIRIYDHLGLYESYSFNSVLIDAEFSNLTFNSKNSEYNF